MSGCSAAVIKRLGAVLGLDYVRTRWFIFSLRRLLRKNGYTREEVEDVIEFALTVRHLEAFA